jgi:arginyl-tRNA synthetase
MIREDIRTLVGAAVSELQAEQGWELPEVFVFDVSRVKDERFGDYATNIAMILAKPLGKSPMEIAEAISQQITVNSQRGTGNDSIACHSGLPPASIREAFRAGDPESHEILKQVQDDNSLSIFEKIEVAKPGYINFFLSPAYLEGVLGDVLAKESHFGDSEIGAGTKVNNEFISANPTGPLHLGNGRGGFYGDALARILRKAWFDVTNEYYVNDAGEQVVKLGHSVLKDAEAVYAGEYVDELHSQFAIRNSQFDPREVGEKSAEYILEKYIKTTISGKMGIAFDSFISEKKDIVEAGIVDTAIGVLKEKGLTFENEGALWLRTTDFGDDKDRVLVKSDGSRTYFASDCGYILHKKNRGFSRLILTLGADHHGYKVRLQAAAQALGFTGTFDFIFVQLVRLMKDGVEVRMSKRAGNVVTIDDLLEKIPVDVVRFFFLMYSPDTHMNFDLGLAEERSAKNPVYYVQYAHARLASILRKAEEAGLLEKGPSFSDSRTVLGAADLSLLTHPKERELLRELSSFSELIEEVAETYAVHRLPQYAIRIADKLHSFYADCRVIDPENVELSKARLGLVSGVKIVLRGTLGLLGIDAPERMDS